MALGRGGDGGECGGGRWGVHRGGVSNLPPPLAREERETQLRLGQDHVLLPDPPDHPAGPRVLGPICMPPPRPERPPGLYPYYTKYAREGDRTFFRHIDMSIPLYLEDGHGVAIIQGSVSLDDEDEDGCTEIVPPILSGRLGLGYKNPSGKAGDAFSPLRRW